MGTYYGFFTPQIVNTYINYDPLIKLYVQNFLFTLFFFNAIVNPLIYGWMSPDFNRAIRTILGMKSADKKLCRTAAYPMSVTQQSGNASGNATD